MVRVPATVIHMSEEAIHEVVMLCAESAYNSARDGIPWQQVRRQIADQLVATSYPLSDEECDALGVNRNVPLRSPLGQEPHDDKGQRDNNKPKE